MVSSRKASIASPAGPLAVVNGPPGGWSLTGVASAMRSSQPSGVMQATNRVVSDALVASINRQASSSAR